MKGIRILMATLLAILTIFSTNLMAAGDEATGKAEVLNAPPTCEILQPDDGSTFETGDLISFESSASDNNNDDLTYWWDFGDGSDNVYEENPTHYYSSAGTYTVTLKVSDGQVEASDSITINLTSPPPPNEPPTASFTYSPLSPTVGETVQFVDNSSDPDGTVESWSWDFGDGDTSTDQNPTHFYENSGIYTTTLTVKDDDGATDSVSEDISVEPAPENQPPTASFTYSPSAPTTATIITFDASESTDPDGHITSYEWSFGDGTTGTGVTSTHSYPAPDNYTITLTVTDNSGLTDDSTDIVTVSPAPPAPGPPTPFPTTTLIAIVVIIVIVLVVARYWMLR
jgi:PKD repeat protein